MCRDGLSCSNVSSDGYEPRDGNVEVGVCAARKERARAKNIFLKSEPN